MSYTIPIPYVFPIVIPDAGLNSPGVVTLQQILTLLGGGAGVWNVTATQVGGDTFLAAAGDYVPCDGNLGNVGVVLPDATTCKGAKVAVKDAAGGNVSANIKITTTGGQTIDGLASLQLSVVSGGNNFAEVQFVSNGANWYVGPAYAGHI